MLPGDAFLALPGAAGAAVAFRDGDGGCHLTTIVKACFAFAPDAEMPLVDPQPILQDEVHLGNGPARGLRCASDLRADVVFTGHAHAPPGSEVSSMVVRLAVAKGAQAGGRVVLDERLLVRAGGAFQRMPITWDQQIELLRGDEWILLEGLHPSSARLRLGLPRARGVARVRGLGALGIPEGHRLDLVADTLRIDGDEQRCTVVWRRSIALPDEGALARVRIVAGVEVAGALAWPDPPAERPAPAGPKNGLGGTGTLLIMGGGARARRPATAPPCPPVSAGTVVIGPGEDAAARTRDVMPFPSPKPVAMTLALAPNDHARAAAATALPFPKAPPEEARATPLPPVPSARGSTLAAGPPPSQSFALRPPDTLVAAAASPAPRGPAARLPEATPPVADQDADLGLEVCAAIAAQLSEGRAPRAEVLGAHGLTEARWMDVERRWTEVLAAEAKRGELALQDAYDEAYVAAWQALRGPFEAEGYARLTVAAERGELAPALKALSVRRTTWMRLRRIFARRVATEPALAARVRDALAEQRRAGVTGRGRGP
jgi:hypothetical protein